MGRPVVHWELWSQDPDKASEFYAKAFDWNINAQEMGPMKYWPVDTGNENGINGGIMKPNPGPVPGNMCLYVLVDNLEVALERITKAGGKAMMERTEIPNVGAFALFEDPDGRVNGIFEEAAGG